jgi:hypothetical protein
MEETVNPFYQFAYCEKTLCDENERNNDMRKMHENRQNSEMHENRQNSEMHDNRQNSEMHDNRQNSEMHDNRQNSEMHDNRQNSEMYDNRRNSEMNKMDKMDKMDKIANHDSNPILKRDKKRKVTIPRHVRQLVWNQYCGEFCIQHKCLCCKKNTIMHTQFEVGHVVPECHGGSSELHNLRPICSPCNRAMGTMNMIEFVKRFGLYIG